MTREKSYRKQDKVEKILKDVLMYIANRGEMRLIDGENTIVLDFKENGQLNSEKLTDFSVLLIKEFRDLFKGYRRGDCSKFEKKLIRLGKPKDIMRYIIKKTYNSWVGKK